jgi:hypothetical protein
VLFEFEQQGVRVGVCAFEIAFYVVHAGLLLAGQGGRPAEAIASG